ncbi:MAG: hypothetical protein ACE5R6_14765 [Candidatus Heimdallarchaeota archaeon]
MSSKEKEKDEKLKEPQKSTKKKEKTQEEPQKEKLEVVRQLKVDLWRTRFHGEKIGIRQKAQHRHDKGFQWSKDMEPLGEVKENDKKIRLLGLREALWAVEEDEPHDTEFERRLIIKSFTKSAWVGTVEELNEREITNSAATGKQLPAFLCLLNGVDYTVPIEQMRSIYGRTFAFAIETGKREFTPMRLRERRFTFGSDWDVYKVGPMPEKVGKVDGKFMNVGGAWDIKIFDPELAKNKAFVESLILFASTLRFQKEIRQKIEKTIKAIENGQYRLKVEKIEYDLMKNPRIRRV